MRLLISMPGSGLPGLILFVIVLFILALVLSYFAGFRNGKREGERIQLQKQVDDAKTQFSTH